MRPPRLLLLIFCLLFVPILVTLISVLTSSPRVSTPSSFAGQTTGLHALFSFNIPSSLFPPSAIISLTDENSTFFLARPAAFGPLLPDSGLSGQLWVGSGFGERTTEGGEGELGCSDIPGWEEGDPHKPGESHLRKSGSSIDKEPSKGQSRHQVDYLQDMDDKHDAAAGTRLPSTSDGTDDHLHHPLPESGVADLRTSENPRDSYQNRKTAHADIQSLQESAEINGKVVLLSRGGCGFLEKVKWAQRRGGIALIVGDDTRGGSLVTMYARGDTSNVTIPALFTSHTTAHLLSSLVPPQDRDETSGDDVPKVSHTGLSSHTDSGKKWTATASSLPSPSSMHSASTDTTLGQSKTGFLRSLLSLLGLGDSDRASWRLPEDSRRPPSSGNINWIPMDLWDDQEMPRADAESHASTVKDNKNSKSTADSVDGDGFVIGVQDWRDPDLVSLKNSAAPTQTGAAEQDTAKSQSNDKTSAILKGGSITPGSGEYRILEKPTTSKESENKDLESRSPAGISNKRAPGSRSGWFTRHFTRAERKKQDSGRTLSERRHISPNKQTTPDMLTRDRQDARFDDHEGLWVTLTPTSMSTSPFFDTLLVLVVSPLLTLTVVYVLLLLRSRIRRRRWRAPKSLVERLPVRTYHTISTSSSSSASSLRSLSPGPVSQTSPLLGTKRSSQRVPTQNAPSELKVAEPSRREKPGTSSTMWRRKYTGRQVECVVCLEEYVDGQSRVMSLPCGHEFHVECITPWLTTRRRTCPICKGDVVRSMSQNHYPETREQTTEHDDSHDFESPREASSAPVPIGGVSEDEMSDLERHAASDTGLLERHSSSTSPNWRNFAALSFSALSGDTIWHQGRADNDR